MNRHKREYHKWGVAFAIAWNIIILSAYAVVSLIQHVPLTDNSEVDTWTGFAAWYILATAVWYYIGYALRKEYLTQKTLYISSYPEIDSQKTATIYKFYFFRKYTRILTVVFATAIPWYLIAHAGHDITTRDIIFITIFMVAALGSFLSTKVITKKIGTYK